MPVVSDREVSPLDIPAPIRDFTPADVAPEPVARSASKAPLFIGLGLVAAAVAVIGFFVLKPSSAPTPAEPAFAIDGDSVEPRSRAVTAGTERPSTPVATTAPPTGVSTGLGGDVQVKKPRKQGDAMPREPATASSRRRW